MNRPPPRKDLSHLNKKDQQFEKQLTDLLQTDEQGKEEVSEEAVRKLLPRYEVRIQTEHDPVAESTKRYREMAEEVDDRYSKYDE